MLSLRFLPLGETELLRKSEHRFWEYFWKLVKLHLYLPSWATVLAAWLWYYFLFRNHIHFSDDVREMVNTAWIPTFGIMYSLVGAMLLNFVFNKYVEIRYAISACELHEFMKRRKVFVSPVFHGVMTALALGVLVGFAGLPYSHWYTGVGFVGGSTYVFALFYWVIREVDDPFRGIWIIRYIHPEWLKIDPGRYREKQLLDNRDGWLLYMEEAKKGDETIAT